MATHSTVWTGIMSTSAGSLAVAIPVVKNGSVFLPATTANRASYGRSVGITLTPADLTNKTFEYQVAGVMSESLTGLGAGTASWVRASATGTLERCTPASGDDIVGKCNAAGDLQVSPGVWDSDNASGGGGGGGTVPTGTGFVHVTGGSQDAAAKDVDLASADVTGTLPVANGGTGVTTSTGTGSTVLNTSPTLVSPTLGAAQATSLGIAGGALSIHGVGSASVATTGDVRVGSGWTTYGLAAGPANHRLFYWDGSSLNIGESGGLSNVIVYGQSGITLAIAGTTQAILDSSGLHLGSGNRVLFEVPALAAARTFAVPLLTGNDTMVGEAHTQTLSNKTFVAPVLGAATGTSLAASSFVSIGANPPAGGSLRFGNATALARTRNFGNTADLDLFGTSGASDSMTVWGNGASYGHLILNIGTGAQCFMATTSVNVLSASNDGVHFGAAASATAFGSGAGVIGVENARTVPTTNPSTGYVVYATGGALNGRGSSGTVTSIGAAEPHCPRCGTDVGIRGAHNDLFGEEYLHCARCERRTGNGVVVDIANIFERKVA